MNKEQNNMNSLEAELEEIIGDMDYISEYTDGTESREAAEEVRKQIKDLITFHEQQARRYGVEEFAKELIKASMFGGDTAVHVRVIQEFLDKFLEENPSA